MMHNDLTRTMALAHEIGHTIGFRHTGSVDGTHIAGTATSDPASIMDSTGNSTDVLSHNDILGLEFLCPSDKSLGGSGLDGDGKDDLVVWRWTDGKFHVKTSTSNYIAGASYAWGLAGDVPMGGNGDRGSVPPMGTDIDQDGKRDLVVWHPAARTFYVAFSSTNFATTRGYIWGM